MNIMTGDQFAKDGAAGAAAAAGADDEEMPDPEDAEEVLPTAYLYQWPCTCLATPRHSHMGGCVQTHPCPAAGLPAAASIAPTS